MATAIGEKAPDFNLTGIDGGLWSLGSFKDKPILAVVFSCNHCPYVQAYESRMIDIQKKYGPLGFQMVAVNPNDDKNYPDDNFDHMVRRAKEQGFNFPYLKDETQDIAKAYGASRTPHVFLLDQDRRIRYAGAIDDNWENPAKAKKPYLAQAIEALLAGQKPQQTETFPVGCTIKWKNKK
ncbi:MAG: thioredoxin family protein [Elusimicrobia bacterium]|nr:thioredoxin family protein [Elusimicrobiota bacterium]